MNVLTAVARADEKLENVRGKAKEAVTAAVILGVVDEVRLWAGLLASPKEAIRIDALKYLTDKRDGRAKQAVEVSGDMTVRQMTDEELLKRWMALSSAVNVPTSIASDC